MTHFYRECFKNHIASSENYVMYVLSVNNEYENILVEQITAEDWSEPIRVMNPLYENRGLRPRTIDIVDDKTVDKYINSKYLFARKFQKQVILTRLYQIIKIYFLI